MDFMAICQGLGLAIAIGIGGAIAALFVSMMGSLAAGIEPDGTDYGFITATWFLVTLLALTVLTVLARGREAARIPVVLLLAAAGALAFAASLAEQGDTAWPGLVVGAIAAGLTAMVATDVLDGALRRARNAGAKRGGVGPNADNVPTEESDTANVLIVAFAVAGVVLATVALFVPPVSILAAIALAFLAFGRRRKSGEKYEGLRILR
jgi:hypothetical protein